MEISASFGFSIDAVRGLLDEISPSITRLSHLPELFCDRRAYEHEQLLGDPIVYQVSSFAQASGEGQLHFGLGKLMPGKVGAEYFMTRGHLHYHRADAEIYFCLGGEGLLLLENELTGDSETLPLTKDRIAYVPGYTAHRTINIGVAPLIYIGVYPASAGHDYATLSARNFRKVVVEDGGIWVVRDRVDHLRDLET